MRKQRKTLAPVINPFDGEKVNGDNSRYIRKLRRVRSGARAAMRSGNPAKRAEAARVAVEVPDMIKATYHKDIEERLGH